MKKFYSKSGKILGLSLGIVLSLFILVFIVGIESSQPGSFYNKNHNAVWLGHEWLGEKKNDQEIQMLINNLQKYQIDTVFIHAGPLQENGMIDPETYGYSIHFLEKAKRLDENIDYQAWLGQLRYKLDLNDETVRHNVAKQAMILGQLIGFDGVHFDIEPVSDDDKYFIELLKETDKLLPEDKIISVALAEFIPNSIIWLTKKMHRFENYNSQVNYKNVAKYADQIVVMAYDTGIKRPWLYRWLVREQTIWVTRLLDDKEVFIAIPAYEDEKDSFDPNVENVWNGLSGIISGLNNIRSQEENFAGVAIYPYWEVDEEEWRIYEKLWVKK